MDSLAFSDGLSRQYRRAASNGLKAQVYYPNNRPRSHSAGSQVVTTKKSPIKIVMSKCYSKVKMLEDVKKPCQSSTNRYKTELCRPFQENRFCKYGDKCQFAHGEDDLRVLPRHPKYKTELCRTYHSSGFCPYGPRCHFIHNMEEARQLPPETPPHSPVKKSPGNFTASLPISPSLDSGISSPDGYFSGKSFEFPAVGSQSSGSGSDEEDRGWGLGTVGYTYLPGGEYDLEANESSLQANISSPDLFAESNIMSSPSNSSPLKLVGDSFTMTSDPTLDLHCLLMGLGIDDTTAPAMSPGFNNGGSLNSARRLPVFDDMMNSKSDTALLTKHASDPGRATTSYPLIPTQTQ